MSRRHSRMSTKIILVLHDRQKEILERRTGARPEESFCRMTGRLFLVVVLQKVCCCPAVVNKNTTVFFFHPLINSDETRGWCACFIHPGRVSFLILYLLFFISVIYCCTFLRRVLFFCLAPATYANDANDANGSVSTAAAAAAAGVGARRTGAGTGAATLRRSPGLAHFSGRGSQGVAKGEQAQCDDRCRHPARLALPAEAARAHVCFHFFFFLHLLTGVDGFLS